MAYTIFNAANNVISFTCISDCGDPSPVSGSSSSGLFTYSSVLNITCDTGFTLNGNSEIQCQADGTWSANPTCDPSGTVRLNYK